MNLIGRIVVIAFAVVGLFTAGLIGTLGARGKLNPEAMREWAEGRTDEADGEKAGTNGEADPHAGDAATPPSHGDGSFGDQHEIANPLAASTLPRVVLPSPFSTEESAELFEVLEATRRELMGRIAAAKQQQADVELVRSDLNRRWDELDRREQELEERSKALAAEQHDLAGRTVMLEEAELENLSNFAKKIEKMKAPAAAELLERRDPAEVAKILGFVTDREAGKIMESLPPEFLSEVAERAIGILRPKLPVNKKSASNDP
jgi:flagellar motility protein MotE (MotC chaperone)